MPRPTFSLPKCSSLPLIREPLKKTFAACLSLVFWPYFKIFDLRESLISWLINHLYLTIRHYGGELVDKAVKAMLT